MDIINYGLKFDILEEPYFIKLAELAFDHYDLFLSVNFDLKRAKTTRSAESPS
jgi:hypothetical protein